MRMTKSKALLAWSMLAVLCLGSRAVLSMDSAMPGASEFDAEIQRRIISAAVQRTAAMYKTAAHAPAPMQAARSEGSHVETADMEAPAPATSSYSDAPLPKTDKILNTNNVPKNLHGDANFPVKNVEQMRHLSDTEMFEIFHKGTAEIPSAVPGQKGDTSDICSVP